MQRLVLLALLVLPAWGQEWTRFRGPGGTAHGAALDNPLPEKRSDAKWYRQLQGSGHSSPVLWGDVVFLTEEQEVGGGLRCSAFKAHDGARLWSEEWSFASHDRHRFATAADATPCVDAERVYVAWSSGQRLWVRAFDHAGKALWKRDLAHFQTEHGYGASPVLAGGVLVVSNLDAGPDCGIYGLDPGTGETRWYLQRGRRKSAYGTPVERATEGGVELLFSTTAEGLFGVDPVSGKASWSLDAGFRSRCISAPVVLSKGVFAICGAAGAGRQSVCVTAGPKARELWRHGRALPFVPNPIACGETLVLWGDDGIMTCLNGETGEQLYRKRIDASFFGSPVRSGDYLYALSREGELIVTPAEGSFRVLARISLGTGSSATPAIAGGRLFLRTDAGLWAF